MMTCFMWCSGLGQPYIQQLYRYPDCAGHLNISDWANLQPGDFGAIGAKPVDLLLSCMSFSLSNQNVCLAGINV